MNHGTVRSADDAIKAGNSKCREDAMQMNFPAGPIPGSAEHVEEAVRLWARNCSTGGGGHGIRRGGISHARCRGQHLRIQCCKDPLRSEVCKWECTFEETVEGWVLVRGVWEHNGHDLLAQPAEVMAARGTAFVPQVLLDSGMDAAAAGQSIKEIEARHRERLNDQAASVYDEAMRYYDAGWYKQARDTFEEVEASIPGYRKAAAYARAKLMGQGGFPKQTADTANVIHAAASQLIYIAPSVAAAVEARAPASAAGGPCGTMSG